MLYRVFPHVTGAPLAAPGGALHVARDRQGGGRHDNPDHYSALYASTSPESAVAERLQAFRGQLLGDEDLRRSDGAVLSLATLDDSALDPVPDLDEPRELVRRRLRPSRVATRDRSTTRPMALTIFDEGEAGFAWWSTLEASWTNLTLFGERASARLSLASDPEPLSVAMPLLRAAADMLGVELST